MDLTPRFPSFLHGGDYNPDQWLDRPDILERDVEMMREAHVNCVSVGIFSWAMLEPEEGRYDFEWLDGIIDRLWKAGIHVVLATPSGARPAWLAQKYPEVLRVNERFERSHFGGRHNHCPSSPVYRQKVREIDTALAKRYASHPAVVLWHISNEFSGDCRCPLCQERFRLWLREKYGTLDELNRRWWTGFWSQRISDWSQIEPPSPAGQDANTSMQVDWRRFSTHQCKDFIRWEITAVKAVEPSLPCTANLMHRFFDYDYFSLAEELDVVSWDSYPDWGSGDDARSASEHDMTHDLMRSLKRQPFILMESTPSLVNWHSFNKIKRPGMHLLASLNALAHGSESAMYFQWRKGRGGAEMFHGAVVGHDGRDNTRTFREVTAVGQALEKLSALYGKPKKPSRVCILYDWENLWAIEYAQMARPRGMHYTETVTMHYRSFWKRGISVDFCDMRAVTDLSPYTLVVAPMLFMFRNGIDAKLRAFVEEGGTLLTTYLTGVVDADDLAFLGDTPHALTDVLGIRTEELDTLYPGDTNAMLTADGRSLPLSEVCEVPSLRGAEAVGTYASDYYAGLPCLTAHAYGKGKAWYLAANTDQQGLDAVYRMVCKGLALEPALPILPPAGVAAQERGGVVFLQNFTAREQQLSLPGEWEDLLTSSRVGGTFALPALGVMVLREL